MFQYTDLRARKNVKFRDLRVLSRYVTICLKYNRKQRLTRELWDYIAEPLGTNKFRIQRARNIVSENIQTVNNMLAEAMVKHGLTTDFATETIKKAINIAESSEKPETMLKGADMILDLSGLKPAKVSYKRTETTNSGLLDAYDKAKGEQKVITTKTMSIEQPITNDSNNTSDNDKVNDA